MPTSRTLRRRAQRQRAKAAAGSDPMAEVNGASPSGKLLKPEPPWLILPGTIEDGNNERATLLSITGGEATNARAVEAAMPRDVVLGSEGGWLVTADGRGTLYMANPATGAQAEMPAIATIPFVHPGHSGNWFVIKVEPFLQFRFGGAPPPDDKTCSPIPSRTNTLTAAQMRQWFYRKVVLSASPRPENYTAMLILERPFSVPAFATAEDPSWRMAPSKDGIEDAIHHDGRFYSISYSGQIEAWNRNVETGEFTSTVVAPRLTIVDGDNNNNKLLRKYIAALPDGRLMAVLKCTKDVIDKGDYLSRKVTRVFFKVHILDDGHNNRQWEEARDIGDAALFVGVNASLCVSTKEHPGIRAGCVYYTDDEIGEATVRHEHRMPCEPYGRYHPVYGKDLNEELRYLAVYSLKNGTAARITDLGERRCWPPAAWVTPAFL
ncbi:hypothetical protein ACP70R_009257 [Stipagrostis hirtigluma subsp. patula]